MIPQPAGPVANRSMGGRSSGRPPGFGRGVYGQRSTVERRVHRLDQWRGRRICDEETGRRRDRLLGRHCPAYLRLGQVRRRCAYQLVRGPRGCRDGEQAGKIGRIPKPDEQAPPGRGNLTGLRYRTLPGTQPL
ncbi:hypothetical protein GCM10010308_60650 [Streptomyces vinaceusdrappus]|nr:hypothetical protein GCM10010308_60650 [Streptomyces vinaceusdrappus]